MSKKPKRQPASIPSPTIAIPDRRVHWTMAWIILAVVASVGYVWTSPTKFLFDSTYITLEPHIKDIAGSVSALFRKPFAPGQDLAVTTLAANRHLCLMLGKPDFHPHVFSAVNVAMHVGTTILLFHLLTSLLRRSCGASRWNMLALLVAAIFAAHPLNATSVAFAVQRRGIMVTAFFIVGLLAQLKLRDAETRLAKIGWFGLIVAACWCCMKSKSIGVVMPLALIAVEFSLRLADLKQTRKFALLGGLVVVASLASMLAALWYWGIFDPAGMKIIRRDWGGALDPWPTFVTQLRIIWGYWAFVFLPLPAWLTPDHVVVGTQSLLDDLAWLALCAHAALLLATIYAARRRWSLSAAGILIFYLGMMPYLLLPQPEQMVEYRTYLPLVGVSMVLVEVLNHLATRIPRPILASGALLVLLSLLGITIERNRVYVDSLLLWKDAAEKSPLNYRARSNLGIAYAERGMIQEAIREYESSIRIEPNFPDAHFVLGLALVQEKRYDEAIAEYRKAQSFLPYDLACYINIANVYTDQNRLDLAETELRKAVEIGLSAASLRPTWRGPLTSEPDGILLARAYYNLGNTVMRLGRIDEAIEFYKAAVQYNPLHEKAHYGLGLALISAGKPAEAIEALEASLAIKPDFEDAKVHLQRAMQFLEARQEAPQ